MVEKPELKESKREWLPPLDLRFAWVYFFDALKEEAKEAFDELLGIAAGDTGGPSFCVQLSEVEPDHVLVHGAGKLADEGFVRTVQLRLAGWKITFYGRDEEEGITLFRVAREVIRWEGRHHLSDNRGRAHPQGFVCAMNVVGATNGNSSAQRRLSLPTRGSFAVGQVLSPEFAVLIRAPRFNAATESREDFRNRVRTLFNRAVSAHFQQFEASAEGSSPTRSKRARHHFAWLVRYQICGESQEDIAGEAAMEKADAMEVSAEVSTVREALKHTADILGLKVRPALRSGRKPGG